MKKQSNSYWIKRAEDNVKDYHADVDKTMKALNNSFNSSTNKLNDQIKNIYTVFRLNSGLTDTEVRELLNTKISIKEMDTLKKQISNVTDVDLKKYLTARYNSNAYKARITRLEAIKRQIYIETKQLYPIVLKQSNKLYTNLICKSYYKNIFDIQKGLGLGFDFANIPMDRVNYILNHKWSNKHYSKTLWGNIDNLAEQIQETVLEGIMSGVSIEKLAKILSDRMQVGKFATERVLRTETTYMVNMAELESYKECDIDKYKFVATLDRRTTKICQEHDGKIYEVKKGLSGDNLPPLHVFCRSTTVCYFDYLDYSNLQRRARDEFGNPILVSQNMNYESWKQRYAA
ncbi:minor capsid protein [Clostridium gasigenes]|uniref:minor capsid protein n=1 Tax=Clostridium gasigenes TaxID=94869 RepID=UPI00162670F0|nr:minor capsid protein [Clostridium gasigenes]MBB6622041.1 minor capsid protein [Clostridium gasigenes]